MRLSAFIAILVVLLFSFQVWASDSSGITEFTVSQAPDGAELSDEAHDNVMRFLSTYVGKPFTPRRKKLIDKDVTKALQALGYYHHALTISFDPKTRRVALILDPGVALQWHQVEIALQGIEDDALRSRLLDGAIQIGEQVRHDRYEATKAQIESVLLELGYFDFQWLKKQLSVDRAQQQVSAILSLSAGPRYRFGELRLSAESKAVAFAKALSPFSPGEFYAAQKLSQYNLTLNETPYFQSVRVYPLLKLRHQGTVPIRVELIDKPANSYEVGGGYSTDLGAKARFKWSKPWVTSGGHSMTSDLNISQRQQDISGAYTIPVDDPNNDVFRILGGYQLQDDLTEGVDTKTWNIQVQRQWLTSGNWVRTAFLKREHETSEQDGETLKTEMLIPGVSYAKKQSLGGMLPYWGNERLISVELASDSLISSTSLIKVRWKNAWLRNIAQRHFFLTRLEAGAIITDDIEAVPFNMRFFAGGDQSVRGFAYQSVAPRDEEGKLLGGKYLTTASAEYNYQFMPNWRVALFVDTGTATDDFKEKWALGAGFGIRYLTPVGPIRLDHAWGLSKDSKSTRLSIVIGPEM
ncbi:outer membrane protein assembly factor [Pseudoalteromonas rubra]|uniref:Translocation and assembly module subunit TamA n=1 Tax=Pseudoalteromonas rubra TaxID=43658 RepID=A0A5S3WFK2_9GAMM|nr:autotransporter assembly complex family protein [Pseudoalteromonas rubra]TMP23997.1 outer membrane protein assembly factor [Pseudoalteromonas rubra]TMP35889.1 outer membrane protein assembly factor [Pseudoalteromonas rubra]